MWLQTGVTVRKRLSGVMTSVTLTFDLCPWPFAWTSLLSMVITSENFMMIRWEEHNKKDVIDRPTDRRTDGPSLVAPKKWYQYQHLHLTPKIYDTHIHIAAIFAIQTTVNNNSLTIQLTSQCMTSDYQSIMVSAEWWVFARGVEQDYLPWWYTKLLFYTLWIFYNADCISVVYSVFETKIRRLI